MCRVDVFESDRSKANMLIGSQQTPSEATGWRAALPTATLLVSSWSWPKDGLGPRPVAQTAKRYFLNQLETSSKTLTLPAFLHCQLPTCLRCLTAGFRPARLRSRDPLAGLKHHGLRRLSKVLSSPLLASCC